LKRLLEQYPATEKTPVDLYDRFFHQTYYKSLQEKVKGKAYLNMFDLIDVLDARADAAMRPDGSKKYPAESCKDIQMCIPEAKSGNYWINPNGGDIDDAIEVHCDFTGPKVETCVRPTTSLDVKAMSTKQNDKFNWISEEVEDSKVIYAPSVSQWKNLRLKNQRGRQNITYACKNSPANVKAMSYNRNELHLKNKVKENRLNVIKDECNNFDGVWRNAVFEYSTANLDKLPIRDIAVAGSANTDERFSLELGSVCFY